MSDQVQCDGCTTVGWRRRKTIAPPNWLYIESVLEDEDPENSDNVYYVYACSEVCATNMWKKAPGKLEPGKLDNANQNVYG